MDNIEQTTQPLTCTSGDSVSQQTYSGPPKWRSARFVLAYLILAGNAVIFFQRVSFSMVIVCMVNHTALDILHQQHQHQHQYHLHNTTGLLNASSAAAVVGEDSGRNLSETEYHVATREARFRPNGTSASWDSGQDSQEAAKGGSCDRLNNNNNSGSEDKEDGPFLWTKDTQGVLLGAVYWGYMTTQIFGGYLFYMFGPRHVTAVSMVLMAVLVMLCHPAALWSTWAVFGLRVAIGMCTSFTIPSMYAIWGQWAPKGERATLISLSFSGQNMANAAVFPTAALLCKYGFAGGWPAVFYVYGLLGLVWCVVWMAVVSDSPETSGWIHPEERDYILTHRGQVTEAKEKIKVPWCSIFSSMAFWAIVAAHMTFTWGLFLFMSNLPLYMYEVMNFDIKSNGFYSMLPYLALFFVQLTAGFLADFLSGHHVMTVFWVRRFVTILASLVPAVSLIIMSYLDCTHVAAVVSLLVISVGFMGFAFAGFLVNAFDIAPRYAVSITSVTNSFACIPGIVTPYLVAEVTKDQTGEQWQIIFFITGGVYLCGTLFFCLFAKTSLQPWAQTHHLTVQPLNPVSHPSKSGCIHPENSGCQHLEKSGCHIHPGKPGCCLQENSECQIHTENSGCSLEKSDCHHPENCHNLEKSGWPYKENCSYPQNSTLPEKCPQMENCPHPQNSALPEKCPFPEKCLQEENCHHHPENFGCVHPENSGCVHPENSGCVHPENTGCDNPENCECVRLMDGNGEDSQMCDSVENI